MRQKITFFVLASWFSMTCLLDFLVVPLVFRNIQNFFEAGKLGIKLFSSFNYVEVIFSLILLIALIKKGNWKKYVLAFMLLGFSLFYLLYLTPNIIEWAANWEAHKPSSSFHHQLYRNLETFKIAVLALFIFLINKKTTKDSDN